MSERRVTFKSDNLDIAGVVRVPDGFAAGERRPAFIVLHGFGSNMNSESVRDPCQLLDGLGDVSLRFDMRGCGDSGGRQGARDRRAPGDRAATTPARLLLAPCGRAHSKSS